MTTIAPYGSWHSAISASAISAQAQRLSEPRLANNNCYWLESRPHEAGRTVLVTSTAQGEARDLLPPTHSLRTRAQEYGGGAYALGEHEVFCVLDADQRIYRLDVLENLTPLSAPGAYRYADLWFDRHYQRLLCVREDYSVPGQEARTELVALALDGSGEIRVLATGADFYSNPRTSPNGRHLSWLQWQHPQMPWDASECWLAELDDQGLPLSALKIAGGSSESIFQPQWAPDGSLVFVSDRSGWWNLYRWQGGACHCLFTMNAEFATPQWVFGMSCYGFLNADTLLCCYTQEGHWRLAQLALNEGTFTPIASDLRDISSIHCHAGEALLLGATSASTTAVFRYSQGQLTPLTQTPGFTTALLSRPEPLSFVTRDGELAHGFYYAPHNAGFTPPVEELPPLLVMCHGGPTGATESSLNLKIQYWTSRGFSVLDVNYRGSTGYGRAYRDRLKGAWGITDVIDVCSGADWLVNQGLVDAARLAIRGSSAGGYTVLAALTFGDRFNAGTSLYGIGDLESLAQDTHKFESRYLDGLVGPYPAAKDTYLARSPIHHTDQLRCPVLFLQGLKDKVVPPDQAEAMVAALNARGIANAYLEFAEEGHGFRRAETIERALEAELYFYAQLFGFIPADMLRPIQINHWESETP